MKILITNDDGINAAGINELANALTEHDVYVVAPSGQRSGMSHALTLIVPIRVENKGKNRYSCSGTPADCILYATSGILDFKPDLVLSGINHGPNLGTDIVYSGTVAGARQGSLQDIPSIAVSGYCSYEENSDFAFDKAASFIATNLDKLIALWKDGSVVNVNIPPSVTDNTELVMTKPSRRRYHDSLQKMTAADGADYYFLSGSAPDVDYHKDTDSYAVQHEKVSVSIVNIHPLSLDDVNQPEFLK